MTNPKGHYYAIPDQLFEYDEELISCGAKLLYPLLVSLSKNKGYCFATNAYLGNIRKKSNSTISKFISQLENEGFIKVVLIKNNSSRRIYINDYTSIATKDKECRSFEEFEKLSANVQYDMKQNFLSNINRRNNNKELNNMCIDSGKKIKNSTTLRKNAKPPSYFSVTPLRKNAKHINNNYIKKLKKPTREQFQLWINVLRSEGIEINLNTKYFYHMMERRNWKISSIYKVSDWRELFWVMNIESLKNSNSK